jgi:hypothetical protein
MNGMDNESLKHTVHVFVSLLGKCRRDVIVQDTSLYYRRLNIQEMIK